MRRAQHAEQPPAERDRHVHERAHALRLDHPADEALLVRRAARRRAAPEAATRPIMPSPSLKRARGQALAHAAPGDVAQLALARVVAA